MFKEMIQDETQRSIVYVSLALLLMIAVYVGVTRLLRKYGKNPKYILPKEMVSKVTQPLLLILLALFIRLEPLHELLGLSDYSWYFRKAGTLLFIFAFTWLIIRILGIIKYLVIARYDIGNTNNLKARKVYTQFTILENIVVFLIVLIALGVALMSFDSIREIGVSVFASAGVAGIIIGFSAQRLIATILAGIQIAITQPIRIDDVVIVEGEWGRIEEINLTFVVVAIWDKRRLVLPSTYFIEKPFQNWTKTSSDLLGTVFIYTDYTVPFDAIREELMRIVEKAPQWDGEVANIQVTNSTSDSVEVRATVSAEDAGKAWELRVLVREKLISFLQEHYPESLVKTRILVEQNDNKNKT